MFHKFIGFDLFIVLNSLIISLKITNSFSNVLFLIKPLQKYDYFKKYTL